MPTASNGNGAGPSTPAAGGSPPEVRKGGPFDLAEIERIANEMFRAVPGAMLPGIEPGGDGNGHVPEAERVVEELLDDVMPGAGEPHFAAEVLPSVRELAPVLDVPQAREVPATPPAPGGLSTADGISVLFALTGEPLVLDDLGLGTVARPLSGDPFGGPAYLAQEAARGPAGAAALARPGLPHSIPPSAHPGFDASAVRADFPVLAERVHGRPLVWLDNGATTQKPEEVITRMAEFYRHENSNIHRGAHALAARATDAFEQARAAVARFVHAGSSEEIVFVRGTTEAINLVAQAWGHGYVGPGDEILITWLEHHSNIVPWQQLCAATGARLCVAPVDDRGQVAIDEFERRLSDRTRIVAVSHVSNAIGTIVPVRELIELAHRRGTPVLIDGAQAVAHMPVDVQALDADWYAFSGHKVFGPTGIGVLYGKQELLDSMAPWQGGGNMIRDVTFEHTDYQPAPARFEAGTASIGDAVGLGAALDFVERIGRENIARHEQELLRYATDGLATIPGLELIGAAADKAAILSFVLSGLSPEEVGAELDREGIAVRAGHHCAQPIVRRFGHEGTVRASLAMYNTCEDVDALIGAVRRIATRAGLARR